MQKLRDLIKTLIMLLFATAISWLFYEVTENTVNVAILYLLAVVLISRFTDGYGYGVLASLIGVAGVNYFFTYPYLHLDFSRNGYPFAFLGMLAVSLLTSATTTRLKEQLRFVSLRERHMSELNSLTGQLLAADGLERIADLSAEFLSGFANSSVILYLGRPTPQTVFAVRLKPEPEEAALSENRNRPETNLFLTPQELAYAGQAYSSGKPSGPGAASGAFSESSEPLYLPLLSHGKSLGVVGLIPLSAEDGEEAVHQKTLPSELAKRSGIRQKQPLFHTKIQADIKTRIQKNVSPKKKEDLLPFLYQMVSQTAMAIERQQISDQHHALSVETEKEKMRANLLRAVSHDLRTPLTGIIGASQTCLETGASLTEEQKTGFLRHIHEDADWLLNMVENLLTVTRINQDSATVNKTEEPLEELISEAVFRLKKRYPEAQIKVRIPDEFLMVPVDAILIEQVIINLLENAVKYAGLRSPIRLTAVRLKEYIRISVADHGEGIRTSPPSLLFEGCLPYPNQGADSKKGMGIGLSICKSIVMAHGGTIEAHNYEGGAIFSFTLPLMLVPAAGESKSGQ